MKRWRRILRPHHRPTERGDAGFTLVEVLVTLSLVAALSLVAVALTSQLRSIQVAQKDNDAAVELEALAGAVERMIGAARYLPLSQDNPQKRFLLRGAAGRITFVGVMRVGVSAFGLRDAVLTHEEANGQLVLELHPRRVSDAGRLPETLTLSEQTSIRFWYKGREDVDDITPSDWRDEWSEPAELPLAVRFEVTTRRDLRDRSTTRLVQIRAGR
ncbi:prepilin-type N-terminal cleavage/methylation domain-containing protein [Agrobacterium tumefaciens]|uniref:Prepilin-type N-terminal cleavage/methylation domain-containing protein n=1 Tax=Agrobacterium tumefaciens TaxID=358 RepID=A0AAP9J5D8_AGRTU|nr:prepilin-type N-terminal cleavage/methylation domain-containing protein [Agrobacterium tumefaciens]NSZ57471.1 prepilin-type N-terminal cleavage/methylation domain-containing protein [Agrobacterium tumefaciens]QDY93608.1 prepilin-type N-terminal cleavage/methylation domain-containing protein [Agrobacterium tumefaciens]UXS48676.1 prepilin-type N-terminal cleavage/methylation domain-containing protein [Agrobacterium tumefaciens]UXS69981.1 prepilin-type N-terminal cleavage/methylation domain-con